MGASQVRLGDKHKLLMQLDSLGSPRTEKLIWAAVGVCIALPLWGIVICACVVLLSPSPTSTSSNSCRTVCRDVSRQETFIEADEDEDFPSLSNSLPLAT